VSPDTSHHPLSHSTIASFDVMLASFLIKWRSKPVASTVFSIFRKRDLSRNDSVQTLNKGEPIMFVLKLHLFRWSERLVWNDQGRQTGQLSSPKVFQKHFENAKSFVVGCNNKLQSFCAPYPENFSWMRSLSTRGSQPFSYHAPLQHSDKRTGTPSADRWTCNRKISYHKIFYHDCS